MLGDLYVYEQNQRKRTLSIIAWTALAAGILLGTFDLRFHTWESVIALLATRQFPKRRCGQASRTLKSASLR